MTRKQPRETGNTKPQEPAASVGSVYTKSQTDLFEHLAEQVQFMRNSCESFDSGFEGEAVRLAVALRILLHDTAQSSSLLTQLGRKQKMLFYDSACPFKEENLASSSCLTMMRLSTETGASWVAPLDDLSGARDAHRKRGFETWWSRLIVCKDAQGSMFTRKGLVLTVANKEGGAHVDPHLDAAYAALSRLNSMGWRSVLNGEDSAFRNSPVYPSIRQIAHEVLRSLQEEFPNLHQTPTQ